MNFIEELRWRGLIFDMTADIEKKMSEQSVTAYIGFDPSADSLHVGSFLQIMLLSRLQKAGHNPIAVVGGGTGMIGDPSGRSDERNLLTQEQIEHNLRGIKGQLSRFLDFEHADNPARIVNNYDWLSKLTLMDFLRDIGKYFTINYMLAKESVKSRLERENGISYTEFSYMLFQAYDYLMLHDKYGCTLQMGGSDQWGNVLAGIELIRKLRQEQVDGVVVPLITSSSGQKFGKTGKGTIWLDAERTSPYRFYQYWVNSDDRDVIPYLKYFSWLNEEEIEELAVSLAEAPGKRIAHKRLAEEVTRMVHGEEALQGVLAATQVLFGGDLSNLAERDLVDIFSEVPSFTIEYDRLLEEGSRIVDLLAESPLFQSKGEAKRMVQSGGISLNNQRVEDMMQQVTVADLLHDKFLLLRRGSKKYCLIKVEKNV